MTNGTLIRMSNGEKIRRFWVFTDGDVIEFTKNGRIEIEDFAKLYKELEAEGFKENYIG